MKSTKKHLGFSAPAELAEIIQAEAKKVDRPVSSFIRQILEMVLLPHPDDEIDAR
jgi:predicted DNA-binding protein